MRQNLVYDLPTRIFHWLFAGLFLAAFVIGKFFDDESPAYSYHMLAGFTLFFLVLLRAVWGFIGTKHARFSGFNLKPADLFGYLRGILKGEKTRWAGHNPASSWAAIIMMALAIGLGVTGYLMTSGGDKEAFEDLHEVLANSFVVVAVLHAAGLALHSIRHQDMIGLAMIHGKKSDVAEADGISSSRSAVGVLLVGMVVVFTMQLFKNYNGQTQTLRMFGTTLQLGENEGGEHEGNGGDDDGDDD